MVTRNEACTHGERPAFEVIVAGQEYLFESFEGAIDALVRCGIIRDDAEQAEQPCVLEMSGSRH